MATLIGSQIWLVRKTAACAHGGAKAQLQRAAAAAAAKP
jgi:hypothetical protein